LASIGKQSKLQVWEWIGQVTLSVTPGRLFLFSIIAIAAFEKADTGQMTAFDPRRIFGSVAFGLLIFAAH
jgi:hypothetical protein